MFEKIKQRALKYAEKIDDLWQNGNYFRAVIYVFGLSIMLALIALTVIRIIIGIYGFLRVHYAKLIAAALLLWAFVGWLDSHREKKQKLQEWEQENRAREEYRSRLDYETTKEATYIEQAKIVFDASRELSVLGIVPPMRISNIYSPSRTILKANGAIVLAQFLLQKDREQVDIELLKQALQMKIDQRLTAGEYPAIDAKHIYRGRAYSGLVIDSVRDSEGYVEVYTTLVNDAYCRYRQDRDLMGDLPARIVDRRDTDY